MTDRILDLSTKPAKVGVRMGLLVVSQGGEELSLPFEEVAVVVGSHRQIVYTQAALAGLAQHGAVFISCDEKHVPVGMMVPLDGHHLQTERMAKQAEAALPTKKRLWQQIVQAKVRAQGRLLQELHGDDQGLGNMARRVKSGDPTNMEAQAARRYWQALFRDSEFRRDRDGEDQNRLLNYGYGMLRGVVARAVCAAGLHPSLPLHHSNRYNAYCLADDLMEPFRPLIDKAVQHCVYIYGKHVELNKEIKGMLFRDVLARRFDVDGEQRALFDVLSRVSVSLVHVFEGKRKQLALPDI